MCVGAIVKTFSRENIPKVPVELEMDGVRAFAHQKSCAQGINFNTIRDIRYKSTNQINETDYLMPYKLFISLYNCFLSTCPEVKNFNPRFILLVNLILARHALKSCPFSSSDLASEL